jgi:hypothetical protein
MTPGSALTLTCWYVPGRDDVFDSGLVPAANLCRSLQAAVVTGESRPVACAS